MRKLDAGLDSSIPQGLKPLFLWRDVRSKAKALAYLEAKAVAAGWGVEWDNAAVLVEFHVDAEF
jgi:hypothetical protein